jgi:alpha-1,6-mannosyltransferase
MGEVGSARAARHHAERSDAARSLDAARGLDAAHGLDAVSAAPGDRPASHANGQPAADIERQPAESHEEVRPEAGGSETRSGDARASEVRGGDTGASEVSGGEAVDVVAVGAGDETVARPAAGTRRSAARRMGALVAAGATGSVGAMLIVVTGGRLALGPVVKPPTPWFGLLDPVAADQPSVLPAVLLAGAALLVGAWWWVCRRCQRGELSLRGVVVLICCWSAAPLVGPPILSLDVYSYVAQGVMLSAGLDPYTAGPSLLGADPAALAADPLWSNTPSPYGPVGLGLFHAVAALTGGRVVRAVLLLRGVATLAVVTLAWCLVRAVPAPRQPWALAVTVGGPVVLLELVGAVHLEAVMMALAAAGLLAVQRGRVGLGLALITAASLTKWPAAVILVVLLARRWTDLAAAEEPGASGRLWPRQVRRVLVTAGRDLAVVAGTAAALTLLLVPDGLGWVRATSTPSLGFSLYSPVSALANLLAIITGMPGAALPGSEPLRIARGLGIAIAALVIGWLLLTVRRRDVLTSCGLALLCLALLGPVLYPWYLVWGTVPLAMARGAQRPGLLVVVGAFGALLSVPHPELLFVGQPGVIDWFSREGPVVLVILVVCADVRRTG